jgi:hypothetical protein
VSDLISRQAVLEYLSELCETKDTSAYGMQLTGNYTDMKSKLAERDCVNGIIENIRGFNCAYDVDKVVEQLEERKGDNIRYAKLKGNSDYKKIGHICRSDEDDYAIRIVKGAVKDDI